MTARKLNRRTLLQGIGGITIGLPFFEEMLASTAYAKEAATVPVRAFNIFFGLGIPAPIQQEGYGGVLEPLSPLREKLLIMRGVDHVRADEKGINAHYDGAIAAFTAEPPQGEAKAGGASIDQMVRRAHYPQGLPAGMVPTLVAGTFFRRSRVGRYVHSYHPDGTVAATMQERPRDLFDRIFGSLAVAEETGDVVRDRLKRSVLDTVADQYKFFTGQNSPLGAASRARMVEHLERIREFEQRAYAMQRNVTGAPELPAASQLLHGGAADPGGMGIDITVEELSSEWRLMADLYALAVQMDRVRFGALTFLAAGERIRLKGQYDFDGRRVFEFDDATQHNATADKGCSHEWWHKFDENNKNEQLRAHAHLKMREVAYFMSKLDGPDAVEVNGRTILDNSLVTISTESGDGRHNDVKRELSGVFHAITSAGGRFKSGEILDVNAEGLDVYNTMLTAMDVPGRLGPEKRDAKLVDAIRA